MQCYLSQAKAVKMFLYRVVQFRGRIGLPVTVSPIACACCSEETRSYQQAQPLLDSRVEPSEIHSTIPLFPVIHKPFGAVSCQLLTNASRSACGVTNWLL